MCTAQKESDAPPAGKTGGWGETEPRRSHTHTNYLRSGPIPPPPLYRLSLQEDAARTTTRSKPQHPTPSPKNPCFLLFNPAKKSKSLGRQGKEGSIFSPSPSRFYPDNKNTPPPPPSSSNLNTSPNPESLPPPLQNPQKPQDYGPGLHFMCGVMPCEFPAPWAGANT